MFGKSWDWWLEGVIVISQILLVFLPFIILLILWKWIYLLLYSAIGISIFIFGRRKFNFEETYFAIFFIIILWPVCFIAYDKLFISSSTITDEHSHYSLLGIRAIRANEYEKAIKFYRRAIKVNSKSNYENHPCVYDFLGRLHLGLGNNRLALSNFLTYAHLSIEYNTLHVSIDRIDKNRIEAILKQFEKIPKSTLEYFGINYSIKKILSIPSWYKFIAEISTLLNVGFLIIQESEFYLYSQLITERKIQDLRDEMLEKQSYEIIKKLESSVLIMFIGLITIFQNLNFALKDKDLISNYYYKNEFKHSSPLKKFIEKTKFNSMEDQNIKSKLLLWEADYFFFMKDYKTSIEVLNDVLKIDNKCGDAYLMRSKAYSNLGNIVKAEEDFSYVAIYGLNYQMGMAYNEMASYNACEKLKSELIID